MHYGLPQFYQSISTNHTVLNGMQLYLLQTDTTFILHIVSYIGCGISIVCLILTIAAIVILRYVCTESVILSDCQCNAYNGKFLCNNTSYVPNYETYCWIQILEGENLDKTVHIKNWWIIFWQMPIIAKAPKIIIVCQISLVKWNCRVLLWCMVKMNCFTTKKYLASQVYLVI